MLCEVLVAVGTIGALYYGGRSVFELHHQTELQNRPFLSFLPQWFRLSGPGESENEVWCDLRYSLKNVGPVPAFNVRIERFDIELNRGTVHSNDIPSQTEFVAVFPGDPLYEERRFTLDRSIADEYRTGTKHFTVSARISYRGVEPMSENPYWFEVSAKSSEGGFTLLKTDGN